MLWTKHLATVVDATLTGGAKVVGFDLIYPTSVERYLKGFDRELLVTMKQWSKTDQIVLGKVQHQHKSITPYPGYSFAVGHGKNIRSVNLLSDDDGVIRRVPLTFRSDQGVEETSMSLELAARARGSTARRTADGDLVLDGEHIPGSRNNRIAINFDAGPGAIPTYSLADLFACAQRGDVGYFRRHFAGKVVLVGAVLDIEDRQLTSKRFITAPEGQGLPERCVNPVMSDLYVEGLRRDTIPAVYIHANAVNNLLRGDVLQEFDRFAMGLLVLAITAAMAAVTMAVPFAVAGLTLVAGAVVWTGMDRYRDLAVRRRPGSATAATLDQCRGYLRSPSGLSLHNLGSGQALYPANVSLYLPGSVVDRMMARGKLPTLGGETREVTIWFSDIADFTSVSEHLAPADLVSLLNNYLSEMTDLLEHHGGFVDKYIGDAIVAVFGAPIDDADHAVHAVEAALACRQRLEEMAPDFIQVTDRTLVARIGVNTGQALVGNIGSRRRFNYTVMGDAVNVGSRLETANKIYGTQILVGDTTMERCDGRVKSREIDLVRVVGRGSPVRIFEPLGLVRTTASTQDSERLDRKIEACAAALEAFRAGRFAEAAEAFGGLGNADAVAKHYARRAQAFVDSPPEQGWDGVTNLDEK